MKRMLTAWLLCLLAVNWLLPLSGRVEEEAGEPAPIEHEIDEYYDPDATRGQEARLPGKVAWTEEEKRRILEHGQLSHNPVLEAAMKTGVLANL